MRAKLGGGGFFCCCNEPPLPRSFSPSRRCNAPLCCKAARRVKAGNLNGSTLFFFPPPPPPPLPPMVSSSFPFLSSEVAARNFFSSLVVFFSRARGQVVNFWPSSPPSSSFLAASFFLPTIATHRLCERVRCALFSLSVFSLIGCLLMQERCPCPSLPCSHITASQESGSL